MDEPTMDYYPQVDVLRIEFSISPIEYSERINDHLVIEYDVDGNIASIEINDLSAITRLRAGTTDLNLEGNA